MEELVGWGVLPGECFGKGMAPGLVEVKRRVERERVKDLLRAWVGEWMRRGSEHAGATGGNEKPDVRRMARRFARENKGREARDGPRWGERRREQGREDPTRAKVLGLRRFWETVGREGAGGV